MNTKLYAIIAFVAGLIPIMSFFIKDLNFIWKVKRHKSIRCKESIDFMNKYDESFVKTFLLDTYKEILFKEFTGISIAAKKQVQLIKMKEKLKSTWSWKKLQHAVSYLRIGDDKVEIVLKKGFYFNKYVFYFFAFIYIGFAIGMLTDENNVNNLKPEDFIYLIILIGFAFLFYQTANRFQLIESLKKEIENTDKLNNKK